MMRTQTGSEASLPPLPSGPWPRNSWVGFAALVAAAGALPTLVGAVLGAPLLLDDWAFAASAKYAPFPDAFVTEIRSRPLGGLWHWAEFRLLGTHPVPHLLVLATLNALAAFLLWRLVERWLPRRVAVLTALVWVALPNRGSTHLWSTTSPNVFSLVMVLGALLVASRQPLTRRHFGIALGMVAAGTLAYEGSIALGVVGLVVLLWTRSGSSVRLRWSAATFGVIGAIGGWMFLNSPKESASPHLFHNVTRLASADFGVGVLRSPVVALLVLMAIAWCVAATALPGFHARSEQKSVVLGLVLFLLGAAPFAATGFPVGVTGFFDRGNLFADVGTAVVYGSLLALLTRLSSRRAAAIVAAGALVALASPEVRTVHDYVNAGRDSRRFLTAVDGLPGSLRTRGPVTFQPLPGHDGVSVFVADYDISAALALRYRIRTPFPRAMMAVPETGYRGPEGPVYELVGDRLVER